MTPRDIITKLLTGETITGEEREYIQAYDPDKAANDAAASARRKAEAERDARARELDELRATLKAREDAETEQQAARMTATEKREAEFRALAAKVAALEKAKADADAHAARVQRTSDLRAIREQHGIQFIGGVDPQLTNGAWEQAFNDIDLADGAAVEGAIGAFVTANKGLILDTSGNGTGGGYSPSTPAYDTLSDADLEKRMIERGII